MLKIVYQLCTRKKETGGNHRVERKTDPQRDFFFYHNNNVCTVNHETRTYHLDNCGYTHSRSTTRTLNDYRTYWNKQDYTEIK